MCCDICLDNGRYRHGERTKTAIAERQKFSALLKMLCWAENTSIKTQRGSWVGKPVNRVAQDHVRQDQPSVPKHCFGSRHYVVFWFIDAVFCKLRPVRQQLLDIYYSRLVLR
jgi:hypothetical protein